MWAFPRELRSASRQLARPPLAEGAFSLGVGVNTGLFSVVSAISGNRPALAEIDRMAVATAARQDRSGIGGNGPDWRGREAPIGALRQS